MYSLHGEVTGIPTNRKHTLADRNGTSRFPVQTGQRSALCGLTKVRCFSTLHGLGATARGRGEGPTPARSYYLESRKPNGALIFRSYCTLFLKRNNNQKGQCCDILMTESRHICSNNRTKIIFNTLHNIKKQNKKRTLAYTFTTALGKRI